MSDKTKFFLASNTRRGFVSLFEEIRKPKDGNHLYILKGGPGSGKSFLMGKVADYLEKKGHKICYFPCASDPASIDAIIDYDSRIAIVDGTDPHSMEPKCPGAYDSIINMGEDWDQEYLRKNKDNIIKISNQKGKSHKAASSCIRSASLLLKQNMTISKEQINQGAIKAWISRLTKEMSEKQSNTSSSTSWLGIEQKRLLSAVSVGETVFFENTIKKFSYTPYVINDEWGSASNLLLTQLHEYAIYNHIDVIVCYCSIRTPDKIDHLIFPGLEIAVTTSNSFHSINKEHAISIYGLMNKTNKNALETMKRNLSSAKRLIHAASNHILQAKKLHDQLEEYYVTAMDFDKADRFYKKIINEILKYE